MASNGGTQNRFDTFVMTGDMIIKTTTLVKSGPATKPKPGAAAGAPAVVWNDDCLTQTAGGSPRKNKSAGSQLNGGHLSSGIPMTSPSLPLETAFENSASFQRYPDIPVDLDIPPDDISSEDERFRVSGLDVDLDDLPPPPAEFLCNFDKLQENSDAAKESASVADESNGAAEVVRFDIGEDLDYPAVSNFSGNSSENNWRNSLDDAIARLENESEILIGALEKDIKFLKELPPLPKTESHSVEPSGGLAVSRSTEKITSNGGRPRQVSPMPVGCVRASKSQENCLECAGGSGATLVTIDVEGSSASLEALHYDPSNSSSSLNKLGYAQFAERSYTPPSNKMQREKPVSGLVFVRAPLDTDVAARSSVDPVKNKSQNLGKNMVASTTAVGPNFIMETPILDDDIVDSVTSSGSQHSSPFHSGKPFGNSPARVIPSESSPIRNASGVNLPNFSDTGDGNIHTDDVLPSNISQDGVSEIFRPQMKDIDRPSAFRLAKRLYNLDGFRKSDISKHLCKKNDFSHLVGEEYVRYFDFAGLTLDAALREFLLRLVLSGETQERERILAHFSKRYLECNPRAYNSEDACHTLTCAIMLLNTDLHRQNAGRKMTLNEFVDNLSDLNDGENFPREVLTNLYQSIRNEAIEFDFDEDTADDVNNPSQPEPSTPAIGHNPFLDVPDPSKTTEYKKGYVMRKCCADPDGRKTALGRRGWKMCYAALCDMVLYLHKDERSFKQGVSVGAAGNALRVHHALATLATDYTKKQHVFRLHMADWSQCLFQTSNGDECQLWINAINYVAASLSAPPLPGAVGSQKKFQRPLMPCSYTRLSLKEQLAQHVRYLEQIQSDLAEHTKYAPERGAKSRIIQDYIEKESFLTYEQLRFQTYCTVLQMRLCTAQPQFEPFALPSGGELSLIESSIGEADEPCQTSPVHAADDTAASDGSGVQRNISDSGRKQRSARGTKDYEHLNPAMVNGHHGNASPQQQQNVQSTPRTMRYTCMQPARSMPMMLYETRV